MVKWLCRIKTKRWGIELLENRELIIEAETIRDAIDLLEGDLEILVIFFERVDVISIFPLD